MKKQGIEYFEAIHCPICGKRFVPAPQHQWRAEKEKVRSYSCMRVWEKEYLKKEKEKFDARVAGYDINGNELQQ